MLPDWKGPAEVDKTILYKSGQMVMDGFDKGLASRVNVVRNRLNQITASMPSETERLVDVIARRQRSRSKTIERVKRLVKDRKSGQPGSSGDTGSDKSSTITVNFGPGSIVINGMGEQAGRDTAEALLEALANAQL
jgi:hypothetical protein